MLDKLPENTDPTNLKKNSLPKSVNISTDPLSKKLLEIFKDFRPLIKPDSAEDKPKSKNKDSEDSEFFDPLIQLLRGNKLFDNIKEIVHSLNETNNLLQKNNEIVSAEAKDADSIDVSDEEKAKEEESATEKRHAELINAIKGIKGGGGTEKKPPSSGGGGIGGTITSMLGGAAAGSTTGSVIAGTAVGAVTAIAVPLVAAYATNELAESGLKKLGMEGGTGSEKGGTLITDRNDPRYGQTTVDKEGALDNARHATSAVAAGVVGAGTAVGIGAAGTALAAAAPAIATAVPAIAAATPAIAAAGTAAAATAAVVAPVIAGAAALTAGFQSGRGIGKFIGTDEGRDLFTTSSAGLLQQSMGGDANKSAMQSTVDDAEVFSPGGMGTTLATGGLNVLGSVMTTAYTGKLSDRQTKVVEDQVKRDNEAGIKKGIEERGTQSKSDLLADPRDWEKNLKSGGLTEDDIKIETLKLNNQYGEGKWEPENWPKGPGILHSNDKSELITEKEKPVPPMETSGSIITPLESSIPTPIDVNSIVKPEQILKDSEERPATASEVTPAFIENKNIEAPSTPEKKPDLVPSEKPDDIGFKEILGILQVIAAKTGSGGGSRGASNSTEITNETMGNTIASEPIFRESDSQDNSRSTD